MQKNTISPKRHDLLTFFIFRIISFLVFSVNYHFIAESLLVAEKT